MDRVIDSGIEMLNAVGQTFCSHAWSVFVQVSVLIAALLALDLLLRRHVRAVVRYAMWMLVFVKLLLPPTLSLPTGIGYYRPEHKTVSQKPTEPVAERPASLAEVRPVRREPVVVSPPTVDVPHADVVPAPAAPAAVRPAITWQGLAFLGWFAGVLILSVYLLRRVQYVRKLIRRSTPASETLADMLTQCAAVLRLRSCPALRLSDDAPGPAVCGLFRPVVLMPASLAENLSGERLRTVLVHELAHVRRADLWVNFAQTLLLVAYFYHPLLWLANAIVRRLREQAVDETVLVALDAEAESYGTTLIDLAEMTFHRPALGLRLIGIAESKKALEGRIRHMITRPKPRTAKLGLCGLIAVAITAAVLLPMARGERARDAWDARAVALTQRQVDPSHRDHQVSAAALLDSDHELIQQVLALVNQVEKNYPQQATHWPAGPMLYHVNAEGRVTVWLYQELWRRDKDCADDEVGWGSSQLVNATGMYYSPDGTPLRSRWYERGGGMKDIRVKIGRRVADGERVGLILKRHLAPEADLWSRDGLERTVLLDAWDELPVAIIVHIDKPAGMGPWRVGNVKANPQASDDFERLIIMGPPLENRGPMLVTVRLPQATPAAAPEPSEGPAQEAKPDEGVVAGSHEQLSALGRALLIYANDHDYKLPETLADVQDEIHQTRGLSSTWVRQNVAYLGRGMRTSNEPDDPVAYDRTLYERGGGTNVLHLDTSVAFESPERLEELGIAPDKPSPAFLRESTRRLAYLGKNLIIYAKGHDDTFPDALDDLQSDRATDPAQRSMEQQLAQVYGDRYAGLMIDHQRRMDARELPWYREHVQYLGKGVKANDNPAGVLAYDQTLLAEGKGTNVLHVDATVDFVTPERFKELMPAKAAESLPDIFILSPSRVGFNVFNSVLSQTQDWTWNKTGRYHDKEAYDEIFDGTHHRTSHDILVLVFTLDSEDRIPAGYEDLLPMPWDRIEQTLRQGQTVEVSKETRGLHVILLAAPDSARLKRLIVQSKLLADSKNIARSPVTGCDVAIEDFKLRADPDLGTFAAIVSIRNKGVATCPKIAVHFYRGDPEIATPMMHGAGPLEPDQTWNEVSSQFGLREGANEVSVVLDPGNLVAEPDETNNRATLRIVIRDGQIAEQSIVPPATSAPLPEARAESATRLSDLGKTLLIYANDHDDKLPDELTDVRRQYGVGFSWLYDNVAYLGKSMTVRDRPGRPIAYDKTLIQSGAGTNVLYLDSRVVFENPSRLEELGIRYEPKPKSADEVRQEAEIQARVTVLNHLKKVALAAHLYASDNDGVFPDTLEMLEPYLKREEGLWVWVRENVEYTGKGLNPANLPELGQPIAYSRLASDQAVIAFVDGHVEYVIGSPRLKELGIEIKR